MVDLTLPNSIRFYTDEDCRNFEEQSRILYENTDFGLIGQLAGGSLGDIAHVPGPNLSNPRGIREPMEWYIAHKTHPEYINRHICVSTGYRLAQFRPFMGGYRLSRGSRCGLWYGFRFPALRADLPGSVS